MRRGFRSDVVSSAILAENIAIQSSWIFVGVGYGIAAIVLSIGHTIHVGFASGLAKISCGDFTVRKGKFYPRSVRINAGVSVLGSHGAEKEGNHNLFFHLSRFNHKRL